MCPAWARLQVCHDCPVTYTYSQKHTFLGRSTQHFLSSHYTWSIQTTQPKHSIGHDPGNWTIRTIPTWLHNTVRHHNPNQINDSNGPEQSKPSNNTKHQKLLRFCHTWVTTHCCAGPLPMQSHRGGRQAHRASKSLRRSFEALVGCVWSFHGFCFSFWIFLSRLVNPLEKRCNNMFCEEGQRSSCLKKMNAG